MLYGNLIFIKKTGGDGSKYPVTERDIKIGRSENCLIRIYNPQVALEHCQLIIEDSGQATLRNLSNQTLLNGKPLSHGDVTLCHGDIFKLGERLARWEYLPTSKFYRQLLLPTGRLVAVVMPQQRSLGDKGIPGTSASEHSILKNSPLGKRRFSERVTLENSSAVKIRKSSGSDLIHRSKEDLQKLLTDHHSFKSTKWVLKKAKVKERKSISGIIGSKTKGNLAEKYRKSTLPSWKVNIVSPSGRKSSGSGDSLIKSQQKSANSPKTAVQTLLKDIAKSQPEKLLSVSKTEPKGPKKTVLDTNSSDDVVKITSKTALKTLPTTEKESPSKFSERSTRSLGSFSHSSLKKPTSKLPSKIVLSTPKQNSSLKFARLVHSESKLTSKKHLVFFKRGKKMNLKLERVNSTPTKSLNKNLGKSSIREKKTRRMSEGEISDTIMLTPLKSNETTLTIKKQVSRKSIKSTPRKTTPKKLEKTPSESLVNKTLKSPVVKVPKKSVILKARSSPTQEQSETPTISIFRKVAVDIVPHTSPLVELEDTPSLKKRKLSHRKSVTINSHPLKETPGKLMKSFGGTKLPSSNRKICVQNEILSTASTSLIHENFTALSPLKALISSRNRNSLVVTSKKLKSPSEARTFSPRRGQRKLSPSTSAERAAKKLKTSCPKKPDKNKKAALLVLGKASRKQQISQNMKVLLKKKILKKAIKQSTTAFIHNHKIGRKTAIMSKKDQKKSTSKPVSEKFRTIDKSSEDSSPVECLKVSDETVTKPPAEEKIQEVNPKSKVFQTPQRFSVKGKINEADSQPGSKESKQSEFSRPIYSDAFMKGRNSPSTNFEKGAENYLFNSNRRCSKRLSSKNDMGRPDFIELSPTALGLIPKHVEIFQTPKDNKRRSSSLVTPKNVQTTSIIKSASTSKIGSRKSVRFSSKDVSVNSGFCSPSVAEKSDFDFSSFHTPDITVDIFVSPLMDKSSFLIKDVKKSKVALETDGMSSSLSQNSKSGLVPKTFIKKLLQSPESEKKLTRISDPSESSLASTCKSLPLLEIEKQLKAHKNQVPKSNLRDLIDVCHPISTPKIQKSPKNDLTDVRGVKKLMRTPKIQKSPKNDLTDVRGVKKLMRTPKIQKSPKNDLTDVRGVKKLMRTPKVQKSPKNDLTDVRGVKKLMRTPKIQKSPKNDLTDVRGVKKLMRTPKIQKSPKNDLTDIRGVKKLMRTPKIQKSPKNDLTDVRGVKKLMRTPKVQKSPKNGLTDIVGRKELLRSPRVLKGPKNELANLADIKKLFTTPCSQESSKNNLLEFSRIKELFESSIAQQLSKNSTENAKVVSSRENLNTNLIDTGVEELLISKSSEDILKNKKNVSLKSYIKDLKAIEGRSTVFSRPKGPKKDLSDVNGVRELFSRHKPISDYNVSLTGVFELFNLSETEVPFEEKVAKSKKKSIPEAVQKASKTRTLRSRKVLKNEISETENSTRFRLRKAKKEETEKKPAKSKKSENATNLKEEKFKGKMQKKKANKTSSVVRKSQKMVQKDTKTNGSKSQVKEKKECSEENRREISSRKRKALLDDLEISPPKLRRKIPVEEKSISDKRDENFKKRISRSRTGEVTKRELSERSVRKVPVRAKSSQTAAATSKVQSKTALKIGIKQIQKVQNKRSQINSRNVLNTAEKESPVKTRSNKVAVATLQQIFESQSKTTGRKIVRSTERKKKLSPAVKRSTRRNNLKLG